MNNNFTRLAEEFLDENYEENDDEHWDDAELESRIRAFLSRRGIDEAWMDEAVEVVRDHFNEWS